MNLRSALMSVVRPAVFLLALLAPATLAASADLPELAPSADAKPHTWCQTTSKGGLRYAWLVPKGYDGKAARNLTVILHGTGLDYRWGPANNRAGVFRPDDVVVSADGTSPGPDESRLFLGEKKDVQAFAAFLEEMRAAFTIERVYLYGHSQGGFFVVHFAGEHPTAVAGIVAHASGAWNFSKMGTPLKKVAIAFQHGTLDPVVPYAQSVGSRDAYAAAGFELLHLRRLDAYNHWPNAVRSTESLDWCEGMTTPSPARALELVRRILTPKKPDEYQWQTTVGFSGARDILRRLEKKGPAAFGEVPDDVTAAVQAAIAQIDLDATVNVSRLASLKSRKDLTLKSAPWLGHLVALREDFRGVDPVEKFAERIEFDAALSSQRKAADAISSAWYGSGPPKTIYAAIVKNLGDAFLVEGLPAELSERMEAWQASAKSLGIDANTQKKYPVFESWRDGWKSGRESYREVWEHWKGL